MMKFVIFLALILSTDFVFAKPGCCHINLTNPKVRLQTLINPPHDAPSQQTWLGGDVASSIKWNRERYIWLFGDTILGESRFPVRVPVSFVHNSIGIMRYDRRKHGWQPMTKYSNKKDSRLQAIFRLPDPQLYFWPLTGIRINNKLLILGTYSKTNHGLNIQGSVWVLVENPREKPTQWRYHIKKLIDTSSDLTWSSAIAMGKNRQWLYIFGNYRKNKTSQFITVLSRITITDALQQHWKKRQYWTSTGWEKTQHELKEIAGLPPVSERSLFYNKKWGWYTAQIPTLTARAIYLYNSPHLTGHWRVRSTTALHLPWGNDNKHHYFFYAAKLHPQFNKKNRNYVPPGCGAPFVGNLLRKTSLAMLMYYVYTALARSFFTANSLTTDAPKYSQGCVVTKNQWIATYNINTFDNDLFKKQFPKPSHRALYVPQFIVLRQPSGS